MTADNTKVTALARVTGRLRLNNPNRSHIKVPNVNHKYMANEMDAVSLVLMVFIACGTKETVVQKAATRPTAVIPFMLVR